MVAGSTCHKKIGSEKYAPKTILQTIFVIFVYVIISFLRENKFRTILLKKAYWYKIYKNHYWLYKNTN